MKLSAKALAIVLLFVGLVLVNYLASSLPARLDLTADSIYSLSTGTKTMLGKIEEPVVIDLYFSKDASGLPIQYKNYATRVQEMLRQYVRAGRGRAGKRIGPAVARADEPQVDQPEVQHRPRGLADVLGKLRADEDDDGGLAADRCHPRPTSSTDPANSSKSRASLKSR